MLVPYKKHINTEEENEMLQQRLEEVLLNEYCMKFTNEKLKKYLYARKVLE